MYFVIKLYQMFVIDLVVNNDAARQTLVRDNFAGKKSLFVSTYGQLLTDAISVIQNIVRASIS